MLLIAVANPFCEFSPLLENHQVCRWHHPRAWLLPSNISESFKSQWKQRTFDMYVCIYSSNKVDNYGPPSALLTSTRFGSSEFKGETSWKHVFDIRRNTRLIVYKCKLKDTYSCYTKTITEQRETDGTDKSKLIIKYNTETQWDTDRCTHLFRHKYELTSMTVSVSDIKISNPFHHFKCWFYVYIYIFTN